MTGPCEWVIVGGGVHGVCVAAHLRAAGYGTDEMRIVDPHEEFLATFEQRAHRSGTQTLRSPVGHHLDVPSDSLERFASERNRTRELIGTTDYPNRPSLSLFLDHAHWTVDRWDLEETHVMTTATGISSAEGADADAGCGGAARPPTPGEGPLHVETPVGDVRGRRVVLAVGLDGGLRVPEWAASLPDGAAVSHVWDEDLDTDALLAADERPVVVGGGVTAGQFACRLGEQRDATLLCRSSLDVSQAEAPTAWTRPSHVEGTLHRLPPGAPERYELIEAARNDGTVPPYLTVRLRQARRDGGLAARQREVVAATVDDAGAESGSACPETACAGTGRPLRLRTASGETVADARVVLATGVESVAEHSLVGAVADELSLARGEHDYPILDDDTLAWRRRDGSRSRVHVSGALAVTSVGPLSPNVVGARMAAERLCRVADRSFDRDAVARPGRV
ncbi:FAD/NAD(P)-binding protein [Halobaculum sp. MBLA0147]|uniref:FAD/NAD(P)-binding protein n=1 Tax=Halobaculum sp. MBLA0147 TaxID=3079934 RepID=UPI0035256AE7